MRCNEQTVRNYGRRRGFALRWAALAVAGFLCLAGCSDQSRREDPSAVSGEKLFLRHCAGCHPQGKNILYPQKDLQRLTLNANGISSPEDIVKILRNPGKGMPRFTRTNLSDDEARRIGDYVLETFR